jgi:hypothetical protein
MEVRMEASRFDAWTRRRFGIFAGGTLATGLGLTEHYEGTAKKKKKRCRKLGKTCKKSGNKKKCCGSLKCDTISFEPSTHTRCCRKIGQGCADSIDCCALLCCATDGTCTDFCAQ